MKYLQYAFLFVLLLFCTQSKAKESDKTTVTSLLFQSEIKSLSIKDSIRTNKIDSIPTSNSSQSIKPVEKLPIRKEKVIVNTDVKADDNCLKIKGYDKTKFIIDGKPVIYLYPEKVENIKVKIDYVGEITHSYPKYKDGWDVRVHPDGSIYDETGKEYYALFWEGVRNNTYKLDSGFVINGKKTISFLENSLSTLGLNRREINEFIIYWLPQLENNNYNLIHFSSEEYESSAKLEITPEPDTIIRVMMVFQSLDEYVEIPKQNLDLLRKERIGFTVVEWGGTELLKENKIVIK